MRFTKDITIGEIPTASNSNYSALFQTDGQVRKRTLGSIITQDIDAYLSGISVAFPTSIFNIADSSITPSQPNLVVSLKNQLAGTVFAAPETLNGTPSFRKLADVDLDQTTVAFQDDIPTNYITTNTTQTGLSGNKTTSGAWTYSGTNATPIRIERTNSTNTNIEYVNSGISIFAGSTNGNVWAVGESAVLTTTTNRWMWVDNTGLVSAKAGFSKTGATNNDVLLAAGGHRPVSDFALAGSLGDYLPLSGGTMNNTATIYWSGADYMSGIIHKHRNVASGGLALGRMSTNTHDKGLGLSTTGDFIFGDWSDITSLSTSWNTVWHSGNLLQSSIDNWNTAFGWGNHSGLYALVGRSIIAGNGLSGGGTLAANRTITLGTPTAIGLSTTNSVTSTSHTHALDSATTTAINNGNTAFGWGVDMLRLKSLIPHDADLNDYTETGVYGISNNAGAQTLLNCPTTLAFTLEVIRLGSSMIFQRIVSHSNKTIYVRNRHSGTTWLTWTEFYHTGNISSALSGYVPTSRTITAGDGLSGGGSLASNRTITLGTPGAITLASTNSVGTSSHTHTFTPGGTTAQYIRGDGSLATFPTSSDSIFAYSPQGGLYTTDWSSTALGLHSVAIGYTSVVTASSSVSIGKGVFTGGAMSQNIGFSSNVNKALSSNFGSYNLNNAELGNTFGQGLINQGMGTTVIGKYNQVIDHQENMDVDEKTAAIQFGVGKDELTRRNAVTIYNDRRMDYDTNRDDSTWNQHTIPDIKWIQENISGGGGGGGNMNYAYIDHTNTHAFGTGYANGLVVPESLLSGTPLVDPIFNILSVFTNHVDSGEYSTPTVPTFFNPIAVYHKGTVAVRQGCIFFADFNIQTPLVSKYNLVLVYNRRENLLYLEWMNNFDIMVLKDTDQMYGVLIGNAFNDSNNDAYFNVNPQIL